VILKIGKFSQKFSKISRISSTKKIPEISQFFCQKKTNKQTNERTNEQTFSQKKTLIIISNFIEKQALPICITDLGGFDSNLFQQKAWHHVMSSSNIRI